MLTEDQKGYLATIPADKTVSILPFDSRVLEIADGLILSVHGKYPDLDVRHLGASALEIAGQNDLDIYAFAYPTQFPNYLPGLIELLGEPKSKHETFIEWNLNKLDYFVEFYLTTPESESMKEQLLVFERLKANPLLCSKYEKLKLKLNGKNYREYQKAKYEFFNQIVNRDD